MVGIQMHHGGRWWEERRWEAPKDEGEVKIQMNSAAIDHSQAQSPFQEYFLLYFLVFRVQY